MDTPRGPSIALPVEGIEFHHGRSRPLSQSTFHASSESGRPKASMAIPGARIVRDQVPPALPPPRYIHALDDGVDLAWNVQNEGLEIGRSKLAPIKPGSSLLGPRIANHLGRDGGEVVHMEMDIGRGLSDLCAAGASPQPQLVNATSIPSLTKRPPSSSDTTQRLLGEHPLAQQNHNHFTNAYDKHLLLRIGKSNSPPVYGKSPPKDSNDPGQKLSIQTRGPALLVRHPIEASSPLDRVSKWITTPASSSSQTSQPSWREHNTNPRSPSTKNVLQVHGNPESTLAPSTGSMYPRSQPHSPYRSDSTRTFSDRGSHDSIVHESGEESVRGETGLDMLPPGDRPQSRSHHGIKRRALSPPVDSFSGQNAEQSLPRTYSTVDNSTSFRQLSMAEPMVSPVSSTYHNSYASSSFPSNVSSITSMSPVTTPASHGSNQYAIFASPRASSSHNMVITPIENPSSTSPAATRPIRTARGDTCSMPPRIGNHFMCSCCPKKPRKFDTQDQLRAHENEKQYACAYCTNRFKNKNEAERHQNSLHLRKQSWSCAALSTYQAAFYPSTLSSPRNSATDTCGFCGDEFTNEPPDWDERTDHLTSTHKFGECNSTKKFFRADHFRQHLKHSHAGKSGKWTNILENNCQREEALSEGASLSPTASEHSQSGSSSRLQSGFANPVDAPMSGVGTIDEVYEES